MFRKKNTLGINLSDGLKGIVYSVTHYQCTVELNAYMSIVYPYKTDVKAWI